MKRLSIIIPVYNEQNTFKEIIEKILSIPLPGWEKEIVAVNDGSSDATAEVMSAYKDKIKIVTRAKNGGKGAALKDGFAAATGDYALIQDADLEYDPRDYLKVLAPVEQGVADTVFGSRSLGQNKISSNKFYYHGGMLLTKFFNFFFRTKLTDIATCYKVFPRTVFPKLALAPSNDFAFDVVELTYFLVRNTRVIEVPIHYDPRLKKAGKKMNWRHGMTCGTAVLRLWVKEKVG